MEICGWRVMRNSSINMPVVAARHEHDEVAVALNMGTAGDK